MKLVARLEASPQGTKISGHGAFLLYRNIILQGTHSLNFYSREFVHFRTRNVSQKTRLSIVRSIIVRKF